MRSEYSSGVQFSGLLSETTRRRGNMHYSGLLCVCEKAPKDLPVIIMISPSLLA